MANLTDAINTEYPRKKFSELLDDYCLRLKKAQIGHYSQSETHGWWNTALSILLIIGATLVSAFLFYDYADSEPWVKRTIYATSIATALLAAIKPQLQLGKKAESYRTKAVQYGHLRRKIEIFIAKKSTPEEQAQFLYELRKSWNEVAADALVTPKSIRDSI